MSKRQTTAAAAKESRSRPRLVYEGPILTPEDIADDAARRADAYSHPDSEHVAVVDGFGARVVVERGHLELHDGVGEHRRIRRYAKVDAPRRVIVGIGTVGALSFDALRWFSSVGTCLVVLGLDGALLAAGPPGRNDARLLRAQALALYGPSGVEVTRYLIAAKLHGQAGVLELQLWDDAAASTVLSLRDAVNGAGSIDEIRQAEAAAANVYFAGWERMIFVSFARKDLPRIPMHWTEFNGRRSSVNPGSPRSATDPAGAILNYAYKLAEIEASLAARRMGLDPSIGILHADAAGRPSFACDVMEAVRPVVDAHVLGVLNGPLRKREFTEDARGVVRCLAPITHRLAEAMPSYAVALGPVVEHVAGILAAASPYDVNVPSVLSGAKHKAAARRRVDAEREATGISRATSHPAAGLAPNRTGMRPPKPRRTKPSARPPLPLRSCRGCGGRLPTEANRATARTDWCPNCLTERRGEIGTAIHTVSLAHAQRFAEATGTLPTHTADAQAARSDANRRQREEEAAFATSFADGAGVGANWYTEHVAPKLAAFTLPAIARATGASTSAASKWRAGRRLPHVRHWAALAQLAGVQLELDDPLVAFEIVEDPATPVTNVGVEVDTPPAHRAAEKLTVPAQEVVPSLAATGASRQQRAIARARREQATQRAELVARVDASVAEVGWSAARPIVISVLGPAVPVSGSRGRWRHVLRKRTAARLLAGLAALPVQKRLPLGESQPGRNLTRESRSP